MGKGDISGERRKGGRVGKEKEKERGKAIGVRSLR